MPTISITVSAQTAAELQEAFASLYGYREVVPAGVDVDGNAVVGPNPVSKAQFVREHIIEFLKERVQTHRRTEALKAASGAAPDIT